MDPGKAGAAYALAVDGLDPLAACGLGGGLLQGQSADVSIHCHPPFHVCRLNGCSDSYPSITGRLPSACLSGSPHTEEDKPFPVAYAFFKAPVPMFLCMAVGLAKAGMSRSWAGVAHRPVCDGRPPFSSAWKLEEGIRPGQTTHGGSGAPFRNSGSFLQAEFPVNSAPSSPIFRFIICGQNS